MDFSFGDLIDSAEGAISDVSDAVSDVVDDVSDAVDYVSDEASEVTEAVLGATPVAANIDGNGQFNIDDIEDKFKVAVGAYILNVKDAASEEYNDTITNFNNEITILNKSAVLIANAAAAESSTVGTRVSNLWNDFFMPTDLPGELNAAKLIDNPFVKGIADVGGKLGLVGTVLNPIMEYNNSLEPYNDDIDAAYEIDPENAKEYNVEAHVAAGLDAFSFGYARGTLNTIPSVYELIEGKADWADGWVNNVNYWVNSRNLMNEMDKAFKDPVKGPIIKQFLR